MVLGLSACNLPLDVGYNVPLPEPDSELEGLVTGRATMSGGARGRTLPRCAVCRNP
jgi:hypothetical protein